MRLQSGRTEPYRRRYVGAKPGSEREQRPREGREGGPARGERARIAARVPRRRGTIRGMGDVTSESVTDDERAWLVNDEKRWQRARTIAARHPGMDPGGVYRVLRNLEKSPSERLSAALHHGRLFRAHGA